MTDNSLPWVTRQELQHLLEKISNLEVEVCHLRKQVAELQIQEPKYESPVDASTYKNHKQNKMMDLWRQA
tara:strand:- start:7494 stop:7703 length:210 start_codon:yes stop_codon:yes gene_type:complete